MLRFSKKWFYLKLVKRVDQVQCMVDFVRVRSSVEHTLLYKSLMYL